MYVLNQPNVSLCIMQFDLWQCCELYNIIPLKCDFLAHLLHFQRSVTIYLLVFKITAFYFNLLGFCIIPPEEEKGIRVVKMKEMETIIRNLKFKPLWMNLKYQKIWQIKRRPSHARLKLNKTASWCTNQINSTRVLMSRVL